MKFVIALLIASVAATKLQAIDCGSDPLPVVSGCPYSLKGAKV